MKYFLFLLIQLTLFADHYDVAIIGSSPFSLCEALYQAHAGKKVVILEQASSCGGAWQTIDICGISHVDLGCHQIGHDERIKEFFEDYIGCKIVSHDNPLLPFEPSNSPNGFYFSKGCFELIDHLLKLIEKTDIEIRLNHKIINVSINQLQKTATLSSKDELLTASKVIATQMCSFNLNESKSTHCPSKHFHLYLLIQDPTPPRFTYLGAPTHGVSRAMNLSHHLDLISTGRHLIILQTYNENFLSDPQALLSSLKEKEFIDKGAYILQSEPFIYESAYGHQSRISSADREVLEVLQTGHINQLSTYIEKWKTTLPLCNR